jgi:hypothetical protein
MMYYIYRAQHNSFATPFLMTPPSNIQEALAAVKACQALPVNEVLPALAAALDELEKFAPSQIRRSLEIGTKTTVQFVHSSDIGDISISVIVDGETLKTFNVVSDIN